MPDIIPTGPEAVAGGAPSRPLPPLPLYPSLFQVNTRVRLRGLEARLGRPATLDDIPDAELDRIAAQGFDWAYFLGVWSTGEAGRADLAQPTRSGGTSSRRCSATSRSATSAARASPSPPMPRIRRLAATQRWSGYGSGCAGAACG